jgi:hypothetical protein
VSVETVRQALADIQASLASVKRSYVYGPATLPPGDLPCFVNFTSIATFDWVTLGSDFNRETRIYLMRLFVRQVGQGIDGEAEELCSSFFPEIRDLFASRPSLGEVPNIMASTLLGDSGISVLAYAGEQFIGIEWRISLDEYIPRGYEDYE